MLQCFTLMTRLIFGLFFKLWGVTDQAWWQHWLEPEEESRLLNQDLSFVASLRFPMWGRTKNNVFQQQKLNKIDGFQQNTSLLERVLKQIACLRNHFWPSHHRQQNCLRPGVWFFLKLHVCVGSGFSAKHYLTKFAIFSALLCSIDAIIRAQGRAKKTFMNMMNGWIIAFAPVWFFSPLRLARQHLLANWWQLMTDHC